MQEIRFPSFPGEAVVNARYVANCFGSKHSTSRLEPGAFTARLVAADVKSTQAGRRSAATSTANGWYRLVWGRSGAPNRCKMFLRLEGNLIALHVDPNDPTAWRREPYFQQLKEFASKAVDSKQQVVVYIKDRVIVIFPNREIDLGTMNPGDQLVVKRGIGPHGRDWKAYIEKGTGPKALRS